MMLVYYRFGGTYFRFHASTYNVQTLYLTSKHDTNYTCLECNNNNINNKINNKLKLDKNTVG